MLMHARRYPHNVVLAVMSSACLLRLPAATTAFLTNNRIQQAFVVSGGGAISLTMGRHSRTRAQSSSTAVARGNRAVRSAAGSLLAFPRSLGDSTRELHRPRQVRFRRSASSSPNSGRDPSNGAAAGTAAAAPEATSPPTPTPSTESSSPSAPTSKEGKDTSNESSTTGQASAPGGQGFGKATPNKQQAQRRSQHPRKTQPKVPPRGNNLLIVGLGNPGNKYRLTRHNVGFLVAEELARRHGGTLKIKGSFQGEYCSVTVKGKSVGILRPITFMNNSGMAARKAMDFFKLPINAGLVLVDEVALDFGQLRLKGKGGSGGHNGLKSLQAHLKTQDYSRLRIGVGASGSSVLSDHVLGEFTKTEKKELDNVVAEACDAVEHWIEEEDMSKVMTRFNTSR